MTLPLRQLNPGHNKPDASKKQKACKIPWTLTTKIASRTGRCSGFEKKRHIIQLHFPDEARKVELRMDWPATGACHV